MHVNTGPISLSSRNTLINYPEISHEFIMCLTLAYTRNRQVNINTQKDTLKLRTSAKVIDSKVENIHPNEET